MIVMVDSVNVLSNLAKYTLKNLKTLNVSDTASCELIITINGSKQRQFRHIAGLLGFYKDMCLSRSPFYNIVGRTRNLMPNFLYRITAVVLNFITQMASSRLDT